MCSGEAAASTQPEWLHGTSARAGPVRAPRAALRERRGGPPAVGQGRTRSRRPSLGVPGTGVGVGRTLVPPPATSLPPAPPARTRPAPRSGCRPMFLAEHWSFLGCGPRTRTKRPPEAAARAADLPPAARSPAAPPLRRASRGTSAGVSSAASGAGRASPQWGAQCGRNTVRRACGVGQGAAGRRARAVHTRRAKPSPSPALVPPECSWALHLDSGAN